ncbi:MAG: hypothetical protein LPK88_03535 [Alphaproteobacteria bacterium]|nr:hypothetical protein [Alphaproteobacteria bacterium]MDX5415378.1 hypothetical protein [Alphaproteobacteria bacterium]MDX5492593.1 hypothetical protein [Alphaproteobacteria bacterium]
MNRFGGTFHRDKSNRRRELKRQLAAGGHAEGRTVAGRRVSLVAIVAARTGHLTRAMRHMRPDAFIGHCGRRRYHIEIGRRRRYRGQQQRNR